MPAKEREPYGIVVGVDFSELGALALREALILSRARASAQVHAAHIVTDEELEAVPGGSRIERLERVLGRVPATVWEHLERAAMSIEGGLPARRIWVHVRVGAPAKALAQVAIDYDADLLVVGTHGRRGLRRLLLGSVAERLVREAACPVLVVRPKDYAHAPTSARVEPPRVEHAALIEERQTDAHTSTRIASWDPGTDPRGPDD